MNSEDAISPSSLRSTLGTNSFSSLAQLAELRSKSNNDISKHIAIAVDDPIFAARMAAAGKRHTAQVASSQLSELPLPPDNIQKQYQKQAEALKQEAKDAKKHHLDEKDKIRHKINSMLGKTTGWQ